MCFTVMMRGPENIQIHTYTHTCAHTRIITGKQLPSKVPIQPYETVALATKSQS